MFTVFEGATADEVWLQIVDTYHKGGFTSGQPGRGGPTSELLHACICISNPRQRWVSAKQPAINIAFALAEVIWILRGRNDSAFLTYFNSSLPNFAGNGPVFHGAYGYRLRRCFDRDQLESAYKVLKANPASRQVVLQIWDSSKDLPRDDGSPVAPDIPCNIVSLLKVRARQLHWSQLMRSNDLLLGFPYNVVQFTTIQEVIAGWLELDLGPYHHLSDSLHLYEDTLPAKFSEKLLPGLLQNEDNLALPKPHSDSAFQRLEAIVDGLRSGDPSIQGLTDSPHFTQLTQAYRNIAVILAAESARRQKRIKMTESLMTSCTNAVYCRLYESWLKRLDKSADP